MRLFTVSQLLRLGSTAGLLLCGSCSTEPAKLNRPKATQESNAQKVLDAMFAAYRQSNAYADNAVLHFQVVDRADHIERRNPPQNIAVSFERPNRLRLVNQVFDESGQLVGSCHIVSNGTSLRAAIPDFPGQILETEAPAKLRVEDIVTSEHVRQAVLPLPLTDLYPQLDLLISDNPQAEAFADSRVRLLDDEALDGRICRRVEVIQGGSRRVYWIDRDTHFLRRLDLPTDQLKPEIDPNDQLEKIELWIEFRDAVFREKIPMDAFTMELPPQAVRVRQLVTSLPSPLPPEVGQSAPDFSFIDPEGKVIGRDSLAGKVVVLDFWFTSCSPCQASMPALEKVHAKYSGDDRIVFFAVSTDPQDTPTGSIEKRLRDWGSTSRSVRDPEQRVADLFQITGYPTIVLLGPDGKIHGYEIGGRSDYAPLADAIDRLLAGQDVAQEMLDEYRNQRKQYEADLAAVAVDRQEIQVEITPAKIAAKTEPAHYRLQRVWKAENVHRPGNLLVIPSDGDDESAQNLPRILAIDGDRTLVVLDLAGQELGRYELDLPQDEVVTFLRTAIRQNGDRVFLAAGVGRQQLHLLDPNWRRIMSFPNDLHPGIADVQFADLDGDHNPEIHVGFWGDVGVQGVSMEGKRIWADRTVSQVVQIAVEPNQSGRDVLWCTNSRGTLLPIDHRGHRPEVPVDNHAIIHLVIADVDLDGSAEWCGLSASIEPGQYEVIGLSPDGKMEWSYTLPQGEYPNQVERILAVPAPDGGAWAFPAADGSIHVLTHDGQLVDRFNYGSAITGLALTPVENDNAMLLVSSSDGLVAWKATQKDMSE
ncbi:MAG: TlpA family protein disulfide reductase [Pirellulales bacterium]|nr:TlpA family protein disulfide reductase [Pirellulales bacterium]